MADHPGESSQAEYHFDELIDAIPHMVWVADAGGATRYQNTRILEYSGTEPGELLGDRWERIIHPHDLPMTIASWRHSVQSGDLFEVEYRLRRRDGVYHWHIARGRPQYDPHGGIIRWVGSCTDIDDLKRAEAEARRTAELLEAVTDSTTDAVCVKDRDGRYLLCNSATARFLGRPIDEVVGRDDAELFEPESALLLKARHQCVMESGQPETREEQLTSAGVTRTFLATEAPYRDESGAIVGVVGIYHDITAARRLAAERDDLLARLQLHIERMPLAYVLFDADLRIADWNPAAERVFGYSRREALGLTPFDLIPTSFCSEGEDILRRIRSGDMAAHSVNANLTNDGRTITCEWFNTPLLADDGRFAGLLCLAQDVTGRKLLEEQYRQAQKMEAVGRLAGGVAHDFNNLLTVINGYSDLVLLSTPPADPNRNLLDEIRKAGERSAGLTRQLLAFSRQQVVVPRVLDLNALVANMETMLRRLIGEDIRLSTSPSPGLWAVRADAGLLEQVLMNLCVNSRDAMPTGGRILLETRNVELDEAYARSHPGARPGSHVLLSVSDTGTGMTDEVKARIFEPFFTTKEVGRGSGLGLATVFGIVQQSDGHIVVRSEVGRGTTFEVYLPRAQEAAGTSKVSPRPQTASRGQETVLLVEDDDGVRSLMRHVLAGAGYTILEAEDGDQAAQVAAGHAGALHLVITDVVMPGGGGREVAAVVARSHPEIRVLFVSGYTDDAVVRHGVWHEEVEFLQKPFSAVALAHKVREVLDRSS